MNYGRYKWSHLFLSASLGAVFLWIGIDMLRHADAWIGYLPQDIPLGLSRDTALKLNGIFDIAIGVLLILRWWPKITAFLAAGHLIGIIATQGIDAVIIRDIGLLGASLSLLTWPRRHHRSHDAS
ncbi:MAG: hypothetical protein AAB649_06800 [Patescibacteria group bacterium]